MPKPRLRQEYAPATSRRSLALVAQAEAALARLLDANDGMTVTALVNRAILVYDFLEKEKTNGTELLLRSKDGTVERLRIL